MREIINQQDAEIAELNRTFESLNNQHRKKNEEIAKLKKRLSQFEHQKWNDLWSNLLHVENVLFAKLVFSMAVIRNFYLQNACNQAVTKFDTMMSVVMTDWGYMC